MREVNVDMKHGVNNYLLILITLLLTSSFINGQVDSINLVYKLNHELFPEGEEKILLYKYIGETEYPYIVDSTKLIRKNQPNTQNVITLLEEIMHTKDPSLIPDIKKIYDRHILLFWEEWAQVYMDNYYPPEQVMWQYTILSGFEQVLKSLTIVSENYSNETIFENYKNALTFGLELFLNIDERCEIMKNYHDFSPLYRKLNPCRLFVGKKLFRYLDPFMEDLRPLFIESLNDCNLDSCMSRNRSMPCLILTLNESFYNSQLDEDVSNFYIKKYDQLRKCHRHTMAFRYAGKHEDPILSRILAFKIVNELSPEELRKYPYIRVFTRNYSNDNLNILLRELLDSHQDNNPQTDKILDMIPIQVWEKFLKERSKSIDKFEKEISKSKKK